MTEPPESTPLEESEDVEFLTSGSIVEQVGRIESGLEPEIDEGFVDNPERLPGGPQFSSEEHRAKATKLLALLLFAALIATFVAHIASVLWLAHDRPNSVEEVSRVFNTWIPVFSGLFGSAATFYFTQGRR